MVAGFDGDRRIDRQQWREERLRFEVLERLNRASQSLPDRVLRGCAFAEGLGVWRQEVFRVVEFLDRRGYLTYHGAGPAVSITNKGIDYVQRSAWRRRSIREE